MGKRIIGLIGLVSVVTFVIFLCGRSQHITIASAEAAKDQSAKPAAPAAAKQATPPSASTTPSTASRPTGATPTVGGEQQPGSEKIVYKFEDQAKVDEFTKLWQQRQGIVLRMTVLQAYWTEEKAALDQLNNTLANTYKLDITKNYFFDSQRRVLVEREAPPGVQPAAGAPSQSSTGQTTTAAQSATGK